MKYDHSAIVMFCVVSDDLNTPQENSRMRYNFDENTSIDSGAEGGCFVKGPDVEFTPHRASHENHSIPGLKKRYSVGR